MTYVKGTDYVIGFVFDDKDRVVLIRKNRPDYLAGKLNGVGGKIEPTDRMPVDAMVREFDEETGVLLEKEMWKCFGTISFGEREEDLIYLYVARAEISPKTVTDEEVFVFDHRIVSEKETTKNLPFLVEMALCALNSKDLYAELFIDNGEEA